MRRQGTIHPQCQLIEAGIKLDNSRSRSVSTSSLRRLSNTLSKRTPQRIAIGTVLAILMVFGPAFSPAARAASTLTAASSIPPPSRAFAFNFLPTKSECELCFRLLSPVRRLLRCLLSGWNVRLRIDRRGYRPWHWWDWAPASTPCATGYSSKIRFSLRWKCRATKGQNKSNLAKSKRDDAKRH